MNSAIGRLSIFGSALVLAVAISTGYLMLFGSREVEQRIIELGGWPLVAILVGALGAAMAAWRLLVAGATTALRNRQRPGSR